MSAQSAEAVKFDAVRCDAVQDKQHHLILLRLHIGQIIAIVRLWSIKTWIFVYLFLGFRFPLQAILMDEYLQSTQYHDSAITALNSRFPSARDQWNAPQYDSKMTFWKSAIVNTSSLGILCKSSRLVFKPSNLKVNFTRNGVFPVCLDTVLQEMISTHEIIPVQQFMAPKHWALALFNQSLKWLLPAQEISIIDTQIEYLIMPNLKVAANIMISEVRSKCNVTTDYIIDRDELLVTCGCSSLDLDIILAHLTSIGECTTSKTFLKFRNATKNTWDMQINQGDIGIASIKRCKQSLESQISQLTLKNAACHKSAVENSMRNKQVALFHLRQKKQVDAVLLKRMQALETIEGILAKIQQQDTDLSVSFF